jgi:bifunctional non-homologous end joining protein LigD
MTANGDVDPLTAPPGDSFVIHQHYATALHHDVRLEMLNGTTPVLVSWAVPKGLPLTRGKKSLAVRTEDHSFEYGTFSGTISEGYGAGEVRIFDAGTYEVIDRTDDKLSFRLKGRRLRGVYHLIRTGIDRGKENWLGMLSKDERPQPDPLPPLDPMLATLVDDAFDDPAFVFEPKWDGIRALAVCDQGTRLVSRRGNDVSAGYPELAKVHDRLVAITAVLDGEIVAMEDGIPSFQKLQQRMHVRDEAQIARLMKQVPVAYVVFDLLYKDGKQVIGLPWSERRAALEEILVPNDRVLLSPSTPENGSALFEAAFEQNLEGILAKRIDSRYEPGGRSRSWLKVKTVFDVDVVIVGWTEGTGNRSDLFGALVMALYDGDELRWVGNVGTGFNNRSLDELMDKLKRLPSGDNPFPAVVTKGRPDLRNVHWVPPRLVAKIQYRQVTKAGRLRVPTFEGLREDKAPLDCTFDQLPA